MPSKQLVPSDLASPEVPTRRPRKPLGIWLTQALLLLVASLIASNLVDALIQVGGHRTKAWPGQSILLSVEVLTLAWLSAATIGTELRQAFGRWTGLAAVLFCCGLYAFVYLLAEMPRHQPRDAIDVGQGALALLLGCTIGGWLAFGARSNAWYRVESPHRRGDGPA